MNIPENLLPFDQSPATPPAPPASPPPTVFHLGWCDMTKLKPWSGTSVHQHIFCVMFNDRITAMAGGFSNYCN